MKNNKNNKNIFSKVINWILISLITFYQKYISKMKIYPSCKYYPTCSNYAKEAISKKGIFKGVALSVWRIIRCNPFSRGGFDPVK